MGHGGMLYSLPSRDLIADAVEYMVNAHCADALVCISNCDKITPGMLNAALRLNIPTVFVSGGPMEGGTAMLVDGTVRKRVNLISAIADAVAPEVSDDDIARIEEAACPTCGSCSGHVHRQLDELPGRGARRSRSPATARRSPPTPRAGSCYEDAGRTAVALCHRYYDEDDESRAAAPVATREAFENAMTLDVAMGGSTNTVLHLLAAAQEAELDFTMSDIDELSRRVPCICKVAPSGDYLMEDVHRAGGIPAILGELRRGGLLNEDVHTVHADSIGEWLGCLGHPRRSARRDEAVELFHAAPGCVALAPAPSRSRSAGSRWTLDAAEGCIHDVEHAYSTDGGLAILYGNLADARLAW